MIFMAAGGASAQQNSTAGTSQVIVIDEIIVTSQKREQALGDIPMSITVLSGEALERQQADNFQDLVALIPGFSVASSRRGATRITLRGINTGGVASTVGVYLDEVPFGSSSGLANGAVLSGDFDTFDLARVEVLRGPQGTLYGASSLGGVLKYVPNKPSTEAFEGRIQASAESVADGDTGFAVTGVINLPVSDTFALRASGFSRSDEGYIDSIGNNPIATLTDPGVNVIEGTRVEKGLNSLDTKGGRLAALFEPTDAFSLALTAFTQDIESGSLDVIDADAATLKPLNSRPVQSRYQEAFSDFEYRVYSAELDWDFGAASLQSITADSSFEQDRTQQRVDFRRTRIVERERQVS
jgi:outer membrane receptor protein involved in Fe transport